MEKNNRIKPILREALLQDLDGITNCARRFFEYADFEASGMTLDEKSFRQLLTTYINAENAIVLLLMDGNYVAGGIAGMIVGYGFNKSIKQCYELFWWVDKKYRGRNSLKMLFKYFELAKQRGAHQIILMAVPTRLERMVVKLYNRLGFKKLETLYIMDVR